MGLRVSWKTPSDTIAVVGRKGIIEVLAFQKVPAADLMTKIPATHSTIPAASEKLRGNDASGYLRSRRYPATNPTTYTSGGGNRTPELSGVVATKQSRTF